jgi:cytochrome P450
MDFMARVAVKYGGIARIPLRASNFLYLVSEPELLRELLVTHRHKYMKNIRYPQAQALLGKGLLLSEADEWRAQRVMTQPAYKPEPVDAQVGWMAEDVQKFLDRWESLAADESGVDVEAEFGDIGQRLAGRSLLGPGFERIATRFCAAAAAVKKSWPAPPRNVFALFAKPAPNQPQEFDAAVAQLEACLFDYLAEHRKNDFADCAILSLLVRSSRAEGKEFTDKELRDQLFTLFFAGYETTATALCWIHYFLSHHVAIRERMTQEVASVLGGRKPTPEDLEKLEYLTQIVQESLRLYSPIHSISRVSLEDHTLGGYRIPAGTTVCVSLYATHRLPQYWPDPDRFDPERFSASVSAGRPRFAYLPFAAGHRNCIGGGQAMSELKLIVAQIAQRFTLQLVAGQKIEPAAGTTMYPRYGMRMQIRRKTS